MTFNFPSSPSIGDTYQYNLKTYTYNGIGWVTSGNGGVATIISATEPANPSDGVKWIDLSSGTEFTRVNDGVGSYWVEMSSSGLQPYATEIQSGIVQLSTKNEATAGSSTVKVVTPSCLQEIGVNQTWQDVTSSRTLSTTYTNSTGKPISVSYHGVGSTGGSIITGIVGGIGISYQALGASATGTISFIVPDGTTYSISQTSGTTGRWSELR